MYLSEMNIDIRRIYRDLKSKKNISVDEAKVFKNLEDQLAKTDYNSEFLYFKNLKSQLQSIIVDLQRGDKESNCLDKHILIDYINMIIRDSISDVGVSGLNFKQACESDYSIENLLAVLNNEAITLENFTFQNHLELYEKVSQIQNSLLETLK